ncbi:hypothetical protein JYG23_13295 [Sedimentibacter sp. zth1]|uniref:hypothetical protein n=1 Tax=Sedimentibacter sp. zth1 TaxID=2816908 RepID=UPI001A923B94|nr:hypothetical protein [Sedimentibacter sp. zth1]QSX05630.1 hypothetical protein JYG23_13295 [Sedimentibacter sp. zth1]
MKKNNISKLLTIYFSIIMFLTAIGFILKKEHHFIYNLIPIYLSYLLFIYFENKKKFKVKNYIKALVIITAILHNSFGQYLNLYITTNWFDKALHVFGTFSLSLFCYSIMDSTASFFSRSKIFIFILITSIGITVGVFLENLEFILDIIFKTKNQHGQVDTNLDLMFNIFGATLAGILAAFRKISFTNK